MYYYDTDECWNSDYDSTWEDEEPRNKKPKTQQKRGFLNRAARDMQHYRHGYGKPMLDTDDYPQYEEYMPNLEFYQNKMEFQPYGVTIEEFHQDWREDYIELEENRSFIQWLFPLQEHGVNRYATPLTLAEIEMMKKDEDVMRRFLESYKIMLGFYGIQLVNEETGEVNRAKNWKERFSNLNNRSHNNLRITRILKCLGEMGYDHFQAPLVRFFLEETLCNNQLPNVTSSALDYFIFAVKDKQERRKLVHFAWINYKSRRPFVWGPVEKLQNFTTNKEKANEETDKEPDEAAGGGDVASKENTSIPTGRPYHHDLQHLQLNKETGTGEGLEGVGEYDGPGVDSLGENDGRNVCPGETAEHDVITSSIDGTQKKEGNSSGIEKQIRDDNRAGKEEMGTEDNSGKEELRTETGTGEDLEGVGNDSAPGVDSLGENDDGKVVIDICPGEAAEHENVITSSRDGTQTTEDNSSGKEELITEDNCSWNEKEMTEATSTDNKKQIRDDNSSGKHLLITGDNSSEVEKQIRDDHSSGKKELITEDNSSGNKKEMTEATSIENEKQIRDDYSSGKEELIKDNSLGKEELRTEHNGSGVEKQIRDDNSSRKDLLITEDNSLGKEELRREHYSSVVEKQIRVDNSSGKDLLITEDNSLGKEELRTEHYSSGVEKQIRVDNSSGKDLLITEDNSLGKEELRTEHNGSGVEKQIKEQTCQGLVYSRVAKCRPNPKFPNSPQNSCITL